ncbi:MAG: hypothetical protein JG764_987 [Clostridiales bacterium]|jgi:hypothetical protein|nr:hypothetical protein [Clostridiales bacterium]
MPVMYSRLGNQASYFFFFCTSMGSKIYCTVAAFLQGYKKMVTSRWSIISCAKYLVCKDLL